ncbi:MAG TPA: hypothetical protein VIK89_01725 [Cytophagaceae bacterium]
MKQFYDLKVPLLNLIIATLLGGLLRYLPISYIEGINFRYVLHAHSHVAFLGWVYLAIFIGILHVYFLNSPVQIKKYKIQFWLTQVSVLGMLISFPLQGYALFSILFSSMHILLSYWFTYSVYKGLQLVPEIKEKHSGSVLFIKASLILLLISSLGPWSLGIIMAKGLSFHPVYTLSIYFYLYFQYNGWFTFAALGLFLAILEKNNIHIDFKKIKLFFWLMFGACIPGYALYTLWASPPVMVQWIALMASVVQTAGAILFLYLIKTSETDKINNKTIKYLLLFALICFTFKIFMQLGGNYLPIFEIRTFIIGYVHLIVIGVISIFLLAFAFYYRLLISGLLTRMAIILILSGFAFSELLLFLQGVFSITRKGLIPHYDILLFVSSILMPLGFIIIFLEQLQKKKNHLST